MAAPLSSISVHTTRTMPAASIGRMEPLQGLVVRYSVGPARRGGRRHPLRNRTTGRAAVVTGADDALILRHDCQGRVKTVPQQDPNLPRKRGHGGAPD